jgi:protein ImuA
MRSQSRTSPTSAAKVAKLRRALERCQGSLQSLDTQITSTGASALDRCLPYRGLRRGSLVEYLGTGVSLAFAAAQAACQDHPLVVVDRRQEFYPAGWQISLSETVLVRPATEADELWACDQALRCPGVGAVVVKCGQLNQRDFRRLQLASEMGGTLGLLVRPAKVRGQPTWADVQWLIEPQPSRDRWRLRVELLRCRGGTGGSCVILELDETNTWQEVGHASALRQHAELAHTTNRRQSRA